MRKSCLPIVRLAGHGLEAECRRPPALDQFLQLLSHSNGQGTKEEQLAFWINAYNAVTVKGIRNHTANFFGYNIWKNLKLIVGGKPVSLDEMEHQVLQKMGAAASGKGKMHFVDYDWGLNDKK